jgi:hypothetical protein
VDWATILFATGSDLTTSNEVRSRDDQLVIDDMV